MIPVATRRCAAHWRDHYSTSQLGTLAYEAEHGRTPLRMPSRRQASIEASTCVLRDSYADQVRPQWRVLESPRAIIVPEADGGRSARFLESVAAEGATPVIAQAPRPPPAQTLERPVHSGAEGARSASFQTLRQKDRGANRDFEQRSCEPVSARRDATRRAGRASKLTMR